MINYKQRNARRFQMWSQRKIVSFKLPLAGMMYIWYSLSSSRNRKLLRVLFKNPKWSLQTLWYESTGKISHLCFLKTKDVNQADMQSFLIVTIAVGSYGTGSRYHFTKNCQIPININFITILGIIQILYLTFPLI